MGIKKLFWLSLMVVFISCTGAKDASIIRAQKLAKLDAEEQWRYERPEHKLEPKKPSFPKIEEETLSNKSKWYFVVDDSLPISQVSLIFKGGSRLDPANKEGLMDLTTSLLKEGTKDLTSIEFAEKVADMGTEISVGISKDSVIISSSVLSYKVKEVLDLMMAMVQTPRFDKEDFSRVQNAMVNGIKSNEAVPSYLAGKTLMKHFYGQKHPYGHLTSGSLESIKSITLEDVKKAHENYFAPNNMAVVTVGDINKEALKKHLSMIADSWTKNKTILNTVPDIAKTQKTKLVLVKSPASPQTTIVVANPAIKANSQEKAAFLVLEKILAGLPTSRLGMKLREEKGWTYGVSNSLSTYLGQGLFEVSSSIQVPHGAEAVKIIFDEFDNLRKINVSDEELDSAKTRILFSAGSYFETLGSTSVVINNGFLYSLDLDYPSKFYDEVAGVTADDVRKIAQKYLDPKNSVVVAVGERDVMSIPLKKMNLGEIILE